MSFLSPKAVSAMRLASLAMAGKHWVVHCDPETQAEWIDGADLYRAAQSAVSQVAGCDADERSDWLSDVTDCLRDEMRVRKIDVRDS